MKIYHFLLTGLAVLSMTGCKSLYGKYERPQVNTTGLVRDSASNVDTLAVSDTTSLANIPWRSVFTDPQLQTLIEKALSNNPNLLNAALNVDMAEAQAQGSQTGFPAWLHLLAAGHHLILGLQQGQQNLFVACQCQLGC